MKANEVKEKLDQVKFRSGYNTGWKLFKYHNSKVVKALLQNIAEMNQDDQFAVGLANGFEAARSKDPSKRNRLNELDVIFDKDKGQQKEQGKDLER